MYLMRYLRGDTLNSICKEFGLKKDSPAGSIVDRVKKQTIKDRQFRKRVERINKSNRHELIGDLTPFFHYV